MSRLPLLALALSAAALAFPTAASAAATAPTVTSTSFSQATDTAITLRGAIDSGGRPTEYRFDYITRAAYEADGEEFGAGAGHAPEPGGALPAHPMATGDLKAGSATVTNLTVTEGALAVGQEISGAGIPAETTIAALGEGEMTLSKAATATATAVTLTATGPQPVSTRLEGLAPGTAYLLRLSAQSTLGSAEGATLSFSTFSAPPVFGPCPNDPFRIGALAPPGHPSATLPDCRAYEQASPVDKNGTNAEGVLGLVRAAPDGSAATFLSVFGVPGAVGAQTRSTFLARRGEEGWSTRGMLPPQSLGDEAKVTGWLPGLEIGYARVTNHFTDPPVEAFVAEPNDGGPPTVMTAYVPGAHYAYAGGAADGSVVFFEAYAKLPPRPGEPPIPAALEGGYGGLTNLYAWDRESGEVSLVSVMNDGASPPLGAHAGPYDWGIGQSEFQLLLGGAQRNYYLQDNHAFSEGRSVFFTAEGSGRLYERLNPTQPQSALDSEGNCTEAAKACTIHVSATHRVVGGGPGGADASGEAPAAFQAASEDGSTAFFTSGEMLTDDAKTGTEPGSPAIGRAGPNGENPEKNLAVVGGAKGYGNVASDSEHIYWSDAKSGAIGRVELDGENPEPEFIAGLDHPQGLALEGSHLYWTAAPPEAGIISYRVRFEGKYAEEDLPPMTCTIVSKENSCEVSAERDGGPGVDEQQTLTLSGSDLSTSGGTITLTCDGQTTAQTLSVLDNAMNGRAYIQGALEATCGAGNFEVLSGAGLGTIGRATLNGSGAATEVQPGCIAEASAPRGIDVQGNYAYWADATSGNIGRAELSGGCTAADSGAERAFIETKAVLETSGQGTELGDLAVDAESIYFADHSVSTTGQNTGHLRRANLDASGPTNVYIGELPGATRAPALAREGSHLYWGDFDKGRIGRQNLGGVDRPYADATDSHGDLFLANRFGPITVYGPDGALITQTFAPYRTASGEVFELALDTQGYLYAQIGNAESVNEILKFKPSNPGAAPTAATTYSLDRSIGESGPGAEDGGGVIDPGPRAVAVAVDPSNDDLYTSHRAANERQRVALAGFSTGDTFAIGNLPASCSASTTEPIAYSNQVTLAIRSAMNERCDAENLNIGNPQGQTQIEFRGALGYRDLGPLTCTVQTGAGSCALTTLTEGSASYISHYQSDGTPLTEAIGTGVAGANYVGLDVYGTNHDVYAADDAHSRAYVFSAGDPSGAPAVTIDGSATPQGAIGFYVNISGHLGTHIAVDQSNGNLYLLDNAHGYLDRFDAAGAYLSQVEVPAHEPSQLAGLALDNSGGAADGTIYVTDIGVPGKIEGVGDNGALNAYDPSYTPIPALSHSAHNDTGLNPGYEPEPSLVADAPAPVGLALDAAHLYWASGPEISPNPGNDLYRFRRQGAGGCEAPGGCLADLTPDPAAEDGAEVFGVLGASADGSYLYFVANGVLAAGAEPGTCHSAHPHGEVGGVAGHCNLYLHHAGTTSFIARLAPDGVIKGVPGGGTSDASNWLPASTGFIGGAQAVPAVARLGAEGRALVFRSVERLTGYDNRGVPEFYLYRADEGSLRCLTCNPTGAAPSEQPLLGSIHFTAQGASPGDNVWATLTRNLSADGRRFFFESSEKLSSADANDGGGDVYEWEAPSTGTCTGASNAYSPQNEGCIYLISTGDNDGQESFFSDASESGDDVFLFSHRRLVGQDEDELQDLYDARVDGGLASQNPVPEPGCEAEACRDAATGSPATQGVGSAVFSGPGNQARAVARNCTRSAKRAHGLSRGAKAMRHRARRLARRAKRIGQGSAAHRLRRRSQRLAGRAKHRAGRARKLSRQTKRCRRANRGAAR